MSLFDNAIMCFVYRCLLSLAHPVDNVRDIVKSPTSDNIWPEHILISGGNPHPTSQFYRVQLGSTTLLNMVSEPHLKFGTWTTFYNFRYQATHHLFPHLSGITIFFVFQT